MNFGFEAHQIHSITSPEVNQNPQILRLTINLSQPSRKISR